MSDKRESDFEKFDKVMSEPKKQLGNVRVMKARA